MIFEMHETTDGTIAGWVLPDNPSAVPKIDIYGPGGLAKQLDANVHHTLLRDRELHDTGLCGFRITEENLPELPRMRDDIVVREHDSGVLIYRRFLPDKHVPQKLLMFNLQVLPDLKTGEVIARQFALHHSVVQQYPQQTFTALVRNPTARSLYLSGCLSLQQCEQQLREYQFKIVALIRNPFEEMAERLLFARYAAGPDAPAFVAGHMSGLEPLKELVKVIKFDDPEFDQGGVQ